ncbi:MAG: hypothetical protein AAF810_20955 [Cyanobacteria bacterium P01_D01_bin.36]
MEPQETLQRWMFVVCALNKPGTLTAAATVFSNRGVSLEGFLGSGIDTSTVENGRLLFSFRATPQKQALLKRSLERLPTISEVSAYEYEDDRLRAIAITKLQPTTPITEIAPGLHTEVIAHTEDALLLLLSGKTTVVESAITYFRKQEKLQDVVMSAITV